MITFVNSFIIEATPINHMHMFRPAAIEVHAKPKTAAVFTINEKTNVGFLPYLRTASGIADSTQGSGK